MQGLQIGGLSKREKKTGGGYQTPQDYWNDTSLSANTWYNMVFTTNGTEVKLYKMDLY